MEGLTREWEGGEKARLNDRWEKHGAESVLLGDIKLLFRSLLYDRRSVEMVALALILRQTKGGKKAEKKK